MDTFYAFRSPSKSSWWLIFFFFFLATWDSGCCSCAADTEVNLDNGSSNLWHNKWQFSGSILDNFGKTPKLFTNSVALTEQAYGWFEFSWQVARAIYISSRCINFDFSVLFLTITRPFRESLSVEKLSARKCRKVVAVFCVNKKRLIC